MTAQTRLNAGNVAVSFRTSTIVPAPLSPAEKGIKRGEDFLASVLAEGNQKLEEVNKKADQQDYIDLKKKYDGALAQKCQLELEIPPLEKKIAAISQILEDQRPVPLQVLIEAAKSEGIDKNRTDAAIHVREIRFRRIATKARLTTDLSSKKNAYNTLLRSLLAMEEKLATLKKCYGETYKEELSI